MAENGTLCNWKEQERKAAISSRIYRGIIQAGVTAIDEATKNTIASKVIEATNLKNATFDANYTQSSITQMVYSCLFKNDILMNILDEQSCHDLLCLNDLTEYVALQIHNCLFLKTYLHSLKLQKTSLIYTINIIIYSLLIISELPNIGVLKIIIT